MEKHVNKTSDEGGRDFIRAVHPKEGGSNLHIFSILFLENSLIRSAAPFIARLQRVIMVMLCDYLEVA